MFVLSVLLMFIGLGVCLGAKLSEHAVFASDLPLLLQYFAAGFSRTMLLLGAATMLIGLYSAIRALFDSFPVTDEATK